MSDVNWWLMVLAFVLGLALTLALTVRRVKREVPVYGALGRRPATGGTAAAGAVAAKSASSRQEAADDDIEVVEVVEETPYGVGSVRVSGAGTPTGYLIKGNEDSMLYHSPESPSYTVTIAEIWFVDVGTAEKAGFNRWDSGKSRREQR